jgi:hypothetical protein
MCSDIKYFLVIKVLSYNFIVCYRNTEGSVLLSYQHSKGKEAVINLRNKLRPLITTDILK